MTALVLFAVIGSAGCSDDDPAAPSNEGDGGSNYVAPELAAPYVIVDTDQTICYDNMSEIAEPAAGSAFNGQDAQIDGAQPSYVVSDDGLTVYDEVTGLTWLQMADTDGNGVLESPADKLTWTEWQSCPDALNAAEFGGHDDWRLPTIKELYSLILFSGEDVAPESNSGSTPFIDTDAFTFAYGNTNENERIIDAQYWSSTEYVSTTMGGDATVFGVNFADGRIKGYPRDIGHDGPMTMFALCVRGNTEYGINAFTDNGDGTVTDEATGLMWAQDDSGVTVPVGMNWEESLAWVQAMNSQNYLGHDDWRLPNVKELQSIVDYSRSPDTDGTAAIAPVFSTTGITNEAGDADFAFYWSGTTHATANGGGSGAYVAFGRSPGNMNGAWLDVHGAGCQRSDPKAGDPANWPDGHGPQGDAIRIYNCVRVVR